MKTILSLKRTACIAIALLLNLFIVSGLAASDPKIVIETIPKTGEAGRAEGRVVWSELTSSNAAQYAIIAMLRAPWGDDYVKPTNDNYLNIVDGSGYFSVNITTGGSNDYTIENVSFFFVRRETFGGIAGSTVKYGTMNGKYLGEPVTINRTEFWANHLLPPVSNIKPGFVEPGKNITLSCKAGETILYTVDGSDPLMSSTAKTYSSATSLKTPAEGSLLIKAVTSQSGSYSSLVSLLWLPQEPLTTPFWGLNVSLALNGEAFGYALPEETTRARLAPVAGLTKWIRTFGTQGNGLQYINKIAKSELGLHTMIGLYITNNDSENNAQIQGLRQILETGPAPDLIAVGNECSRMENFNPAKLAACIDAVRELIQSESLVIPVGSVDIAGADWSMAVLNKLDFVGVNIYHNVWDNTLENEIVAKTKQTYADKVAQYQKMVLVGETGHPYSGGTYTTEDGATRTPSIAKAVSYLSSFLQWIQKDNIPSFYFEAYDEPVKSQNGHPIEQYFGIMDGNLQIHPFYRETIALPANTIQLPGKISMNPYPNPVKDVFTLTGLPSGTAIKIYDLSGKIVKVQYFNTLQNSTGTINVSDLPDGTYLVKAGESICKIIKSR